MSLWHQEVTVDGTEKDDARKTGAHSTDSYDPHQEVAVFHQGKHECSLDADYDAVNVERRKF